MFWVLNDEDDAGGGTVPSSKRIAEVRWLSRPGFTAPSGSSFYLWDFKLFFHIYFPSFQSLDGFGLDYNSRKSVGANIGDDTGDEDSGFSSDDDTHDVPVGTNIDDNESVFFHG